MIKNLKLRLNLDVEAEKRVYDYLQNSERSISKEAIRSINKYLDLIEERKNEDRFLDRVTATIQDNLKALTPLLNLLTLTQPVAQPQQAVPVSEKKTVPLKKICLNFSIAFRRHFCCQKTANYQAICHRFYYTVQIPIFLATFVESLTTLLSTRFLRLLRQHYKKYKAQQKG